MIANGLLSTAPIATARDLFNWPGSVPAVSANGTATTASFYPGRAAGRRLQGRISVEFCGRSMPSTLARSFTTAHRQAAATPHQPRSGSSQHRLWPTVRFTSALQNIDRRLRTAPRRAANRRRRPPHRRFVDHRDHNSTTLSIVGGDTAAHGGEGSLTYTWSVNSAQAGIGFVLGERHECGQVGHSHLRCARRLQPALHHHEHHRTERQSRARSTVNVIHGVRRPRPFLPRLISVLSEWQAAVHGDRCRPVRHGHPIDSSLEVVTWTAGSVGAIGKTRLLPLQARRDRGNATVRAEIQYRRRDDGHQRG